MSLQRHKRRLMCIEKYEVGQMTILELLRVEAVATRPTTREEHDGDTGGNDAAGGEAEGALGSVDADMSASAASGAEHGRGVPLGWRPRVWLHRPRRGRQGPLLPRLPHRRRQRADPGRPGGVCEGLDVRKGKERAEEVSG